MPTKERWAKMTDEQKMLSKLATKKHQQENPEYWRVLNRKSYLKKVGTHTHTSPLMNTPERRAKRARLKSSLRNMRTKHRIPLWADKEAIKHFYANRPDGHHVDHIIPLNGKKVSGLHVIENLQYLPALVNLKKGNKEIYHPIHD